MVGEISKIFALRVWGRISLFGQCSDPILERYRPMIHSRSPFRLVVGSCMIRHLNGLSESEPNGLVSAAECAN